MGYLELPGGFTNFDRAVFSLWFRAPASSLGSATSLGGQSLLNNCVPLITLGRPNLDSSGQDLGPSFIGINTDDDVPALAAAMHCGSRGSFTGNYYDGVGVCNPPRTPSAPARDYFSLFPAGEGYRIPTPADRWNHLMLSVSFVGGMSVTNTPRANFGTAGANWLCWVRLNGVNYSGNALNDSGLRASTNHGGANQVLSVCTSDVPVLENTPFISNYEGNQTFPPFGPICNPGSEQFDAAYSFSGASIDSSGRPIGVPASGAYSAYIQQIQMAELQIYTGVTCQSSSPFIAGGRPANVSTAIAALGKHPNIYLGGTSENWITGVNQGSDGGIFNTVGTISNFAGGPTL